MAKNGQLLARMKQFAHLVRPPYVPSMLVGFRAKNYRGRRRHLRLTWHK